MSLIKFGSQAFFDEFRKRLNEDEEFRRLAKENDYNATEMVFVPEIDFAYYQHTNGGSVQNLRVVKREEIPSLKETTELVYEVAQFENILKLCRGETTPFKLVLSGKMKVQGGTGKALKFYPAASRAMGILKDLCASREVELPKDASEFIS